MDPLLQSKLQFLRVRNEKVDGNSTRSESEAFQRLRSKVTCTSVMLTLGSVRSEGIETKVPKELVNTESTILILLALCNTISNPFVPFHIIRFICIVPFALLGPLASK